MEAAHLCGSWQRHRRRVRLRERESRERLRTTTSQQQQQQHYQRLHSLLTSLQSVPHCLFPLLSSLLCQLQCSPTPTRSRTAGILLLSTPLLPSQVVTLLMPPHIPLSPPTLPMPPHIPPLQLPLQHVLCQPLT